MKRIFPYIFSTSLLSMVFVVLCLTLYAQQEHGTPIALTPQELEESLQISKEEQDLEHTLELDTPAKVDLNDQLDAVNNTTESLGDTAQKPSPTTPPTTTPQQKPQPLHTNKPINLETPADEPEILKETENESEGESYFAEATKDRDEYEGEDEGEEIKQPGKPTATPTAATPKAPTPLKPKVQVPKTPKPLGLHEQEKVEFYFEDADLQNLITQISELFNVTFIPDDTVMPLQKDGRAIKGNKISFKTNKPLTKEQAWNLFLTFLDVSQLAVVPQAEPHMYRIVSTAATKTAPLPTYIGVKPGALPDNNQMIRYLHFLENISIDGVKNIIDALRSPGTSFIPLPDLNAFILVDRAYNIKSLMEIITELDRVTLPQSMSVLKLRRADVMDVKKLYDSIMQGTDTSITARLFPGARKSTNMLYFSDNIRIIPEPRTNTLILLGAQDAIKKLEDFILKYVDVELGLESFSPLRVYKLKYADAKTVAQLMNDVVQFGKSTAAGQTGGVRDGDKYFKKISFIPEPDTNSIIVKGDEEDWLRAKEIIANIDQPQPEVFLEVLILTVDLDEQKELGVQLRNTSLDGKTDYGINGLVGPNVNFQTSGIAFGSTPNSFALNTAASTTGAQRLLGNILSLLGNSAVAGNTVLTLGVDIMGSSVWGVLILLEKVANTQVVSNPFLICANKQASRVAVGERRRVVSGTTLSGAAPQSSFSDNDASLEVKVTPQINSDGMIVLDIEVTLNQFTNPNDPTDATKTTKNIKTTTVVADREVLALGGLIRNNIVTSISKVPILGDIPIIGWLFRNEQKEQTKQNLLILISSHILQPGSEQQIVSITKERINGYHGTLDGMHETAEIGILFTVSSLSQNGDQQKKCLIILCLENKKQH